MNKDEFIKSILIRIKTDLSSPRYYSLANKPKLVLSYPLFTLLKDYVVNSLTEIKLFSVPIRIIDSTKYEYYIYLDSAIFKKKQETMIVDTFEEEIQ